MSDIIRLLHVGLGPIGCGIVRLAQTHPGLSSLGGVDVDLAKAGRTLAQVAEVEGLAAPIWPSLAEGLAATQPDVAILCTGSRLVAVAETLQTCIEAGVHVVSTCEELAWPWESQPELAGKLDALAEKRGVALLGSGVNPGFVMDLLPLLASAISPGVERVRVRRAVNLSLRRRPLQAKMGVGDSRQAWQERADSGLLGHVGLAESAYLLAAGLGWRLDRIRRSLEPLIAERVYASRMGDVPSGRVVGTRERLVAEAVDRTVLEMTLVMGLELADAGDSVWLEGPEPLSLVMRSPNGDVATAAIVVNAAVRVHEARPGLRTVLDFPLIRSRALG